MLFTQSVLKGNYYKIILFCLNCFLVAEVIAKCALQLFIKPIPALKYKLYWQIFLKALAQLETVA